MDTGKALSAIDLTSIRSSTGNGVLVGVLDTGFDNHLSSIKNTKLLLGPAARNQHVKGYSMNQHDFPFTLH